jgi:hypothetical protein
MTKKCSQCQVLKPHVEFHNSKANKDGKCWLCKKCTLENRKKYYYTKNGQEKKKASNRLLVTGFTQEDFKSKLEEQGGVCAICGTDNPGKLDFCADHDHITGTKRGVLCRKCNTGIGQLKDSTELLQAAIDYLNKYKVSEDTQ